MTIHPISRQSHPFFARQPQHLRQTHAFHGIIFLRQSKKGHVAKSGPENHMELPQSPSVNDINYPLVI
jgi:hypothetical protein